MFKSIIAIATTIAVLLGLLVSSIIFGASAIPVVLLAIVGVLFWINQSAPEHKEELGEDEDHLLH